MSEVDRMAVIARKWSGQKLYAEWCGNPFGDRAAYWQGMNPADKRHWENLADVLNEAERGAVGALCSELRGQIIELDAKTTGRAMYDHERREWERLKAELAKWGQ